MTRGCGTYRKIQTLAAQRRTAWELSDFVLVGLRTENEHYSLLENDYIVEICAAFLASALGMVDAAGGSK